MARLERPAIVVVSHICPFPPIHGNRSRLVALLRWLKSNGFRVTYVLQPLDLDESSDIPALASIVHHLEIVRAPHERLRILSLLRRTAGRVAKWVLPDPVVARMRRFLEHSQPSNPTVMERWGTGGDRHIDRWCWPGTCKAVRRLVEETRPTAIIAEYALLSKCFEEVPPSTLKVIDTVEVFFRNRERFNVEGLAAPFVCTPESESTALERGDVLIGIQKNEAEALKQLFPSKRVITVGHTYARSGVPSRSPANGVVLYVGSSNPFNVHGLQLFLARAWPGIVAAVPHARLRIVGSCPRVAGSEQAGVVYVGRVSDDALTREYETAHVVINPQVAGTGLKIKCVEALSAGCPMVMNQAGADGIEEGAGSAFLLASDWDEFLKHVVRIITDDPLRTALESEAAGLAVRLFSAEATFSELARELEQRRSSAPSSR